MKNMTKSVSLSNMILGLLAVLVATPLATLAVATPPERMTYQGYVVDGNGAVLGNGAPENHEIIFRIYDDADLLLWSEQQTVTVDAGYFSVLLGEGADANDPGTFNKLSEVFTDSERYIGITVKGIGPGGVDADILPKLRLVSSPYAFMAANVAPDTVINSGNIAPDSLVAADLAPNSVGTSEVADKSLTSADIANNSIGTLQVLDNSIASADILNNSITSADILNGTIAQADLGNVHSLDRANGVAYGVYVESTGAVGINTTTPRSPVANAGLRVKNGGHVVVDNDFGFLSVNAAGTSFGAGIDSGKNDELHLYSKGANRMTINGATGISSLKGKLQVNNVVYTGAALSVNGGGGNIFTCFNDTGSSPNSYRFTVSSTGTYMAGVTRVTSDRRLKQDIEPLTGVLDRVLALQPSTYELKDNPDGGHQIGVIAQEVIPLFPQLVSRPEGEEMYAVNYSGLGVVAIAAIKELHAEVETLESKNAALKSRLDALEARLNALAP